MPASQFTLVSDTQVKIVAPEQSGEFLPVVVQTGEGECNSNVTVEISVIALRSVDQKSDPGDVAERHLR